MMTRTPRWIAPMLKEAAACTTRMPWERGAPRAALIAARQAAKLEQLAPLKRASA